MSKGKSYDPGDRAWEVIQQKTFTKWTNNHLRKRGYPALEDLQTGFDTGTSLMQLMDSLYAVGVPKHRIGATMRMHKVDNLNTAFAKVKEAGVNLFGIGPENLLDHDLKFILGMVWQVILDFQVKGISVEELSAKEALLLWCQRKTEGYEHVKIENFTMSWQSGLGFCALINRHRPDLIDFKSLNPADNAGNLELAFRIAEDKLGIPRLLDVEDMEPRPDEKSVITYVSEYYHCFASQNKYEVASRRIGKLIDLTASNDELKTRYCERAQELLDWINGQTTEFQGRDVENSLPGVRAKIGELGDYRKGVRPPKRAEKIDVESLFNQLQTKLSANNRPAFVPPEGLAPEEIDGAWKTLLTEEASWDDFLRQELARQEELDLLTRRLANFATRLEARIAAKAAYLKTDETVDSIHVAQSKIKQLDAYHAEYEDAKVHVDSLQEIAARIAQLGYANSSDVNQRVNKITQDWEGLQDLESHKRHDLQKKLEHELLTEEKRKAYAKHAQEYNSWASGIVADAEEYAFGNTLESVTSFVTQLDAMDAEWTAQSTQKKTEVDRLYKELTALTSDAKYTPLTSNDFAVKHKQVLDAIGRRRTAYNTELERQKAHEAKRREYAAKAKDFVAWLEAQRKAVDGVTGSPDQRIAAVKKLFGEGAELNSRLGALSTFTEEMTKMGIYENKHTDFPLPVCSAKANHLENYVRHTITVLEEEKALEGRLSAQKAESAKKEAQDNLLLSYSTQAQALRIWMENTDVQLNDPIVANSPADVEKLQEAFGAFRSAVPDQEARLNELVSLSDQIEGEGLAVGAEVALATVQGEWAGVLGQMDAREAALAQEASRQEANVALQKDFAAAANEFASWLSTHKATVDGVSGDLKAQLAALQDVQPVLNGGESKLDEIQSLDGLVVEAGVFHNAFTSHNVASLKAEFDQLRKVCREKQDFLEKEMAAKAGSDVSPEQLKEFTATFKHFDRDNSGRLQRLELKSCLQSLGEDPSDDQMGRLMEQLASGGGGVPFDAFVDFMVKKTKDADTQDQILEAFRMLSDGQEFVTEEQLRRTLQTDQVEYLLSHMTPVEGRENCYDFATWSAAAFGH